MPSRTLQQCLNDLRRTGQLVEIDQPIDPHLQAAEIQRRVYQAGGPAILYRRVKGCEFPMVSNLFGTMDRTRFLFRHTLEAVRQLVALKVDPNNGWKQPWRSLKAVPAAIRMLPRSVRSGPVMKHQTTIDRLPQLVSWPDDGGPFITLPQVYSEDPGQPGLMKSNLGMYRIQLGGNSYHQNEQIGLHYQIHRSIGVHHTKALEKGEPFSCEYFCRRSSGDDFGGGDAFAGGDVGVDVWRCSGWLQNSDDPSEKRTFHLC